MTSTVLRRWIIRGDLTVFGFVLLASVPLWLLLARDHGAALIIAAGVSAVAGVASVSWSRRAWAALLQEVVAQHAGTDPGPSPVPWIGETLWRRRNGFDPAVDGPNELLAEVDPMIARFGDDARGAFVKPALRPVTPEERALVAEAPPEPPIPTIRGDADALRAALEGTPGRFIAVQPRWPVCCGQLAILEGVQGEPDAPEGSFLPSGPGEPDRADPTLGRHRYLCGACGRRYATDPEW